MTTDVEAEVRKWGNSLGVIIPADAAKAEGLKAHDKVMLRFFKVRYPDPSFFGSARDWKIDAQKLKDQLRREHEW